MPAAACRMTQASTHYDPAAYKADAWAGNDAGLCYNVVGRRATTWYPEDCTGIPLGTMSKNDLLSVKAITNNRTSPLKSAPAYPQATNYPAMLCTHCP